MQHTVYAISPRHTYINTHAHTHTHNNNNNTYNKNQPIDTKHYSHTTQSRAKRHAISRQNSAVSRQIAATQS